METESSEDSPSTDIPTEELRIKSRLAANARSRPRRGLLNSFLLAGSSSCCNRSVMPCESNPCTKPRQIGRRVGYSPISLPGDGGVGWHYLF